MNLPHLCWVQMRDGAFAIYLFFVPIKLLSHLTKIYAKHKKSVLKRRQLFLAQITVQMWLYTLALWLWGTVRAPRFFFSPFTIPSNGAGQNDSLMTCTLFWVLVPTFAFGLIGNDPHSRLVWLAMIFEATGGSSWGREWQQALHSPLIQQVIWSPWFQLWS